MMFAEPPKLSEVLEIIEHIALEHRMSTSFGLYDNLVDGGMTSIAIVDIMLAVESKYFLTIPDNELVPANFATIDSIYKMLVRLFDLQNCITVDEMNVGVACTQKAFRFRSCGSE